MYGNPYVPNNQIMQQDLMNLRDRIDKQLTQIQNPQPQNPQAPITQNFQLAPNQNNTGIKYVTSIDDVKKELVFGDTMFVNKNFTQMYMKDIIGGIRTFNLQEIIELDDKDKEILELKKELESMKEVINNARNGDEDVDESTTIKKSTSIQSNKSSKK